MSSPDLQLVLNTLNEAAASNPKALASTESIGGMRVRVVVSAAEQGLCWCRGHG